MSTLTPNTHHNQMIGCTQTLKRSSTNQMGAFKKQKHFWGKQQNATKAYTTHQLIKKDVPKTPKPFSRKVKDVDLWLKHFSANQMGVPKAFFFLIITPKQVAHIAHNLIQLHSKDDPGNFLLRWNNILVCLTSLINSLIWKLKHFEIQGKQTHEKKHTKKHSHTCINN